jgi:hypothetical protein
MIRNPVSGRIAAYFYSAALDIKTSFILGIYTALIYD